MIKTERAGGMNRSNRIIADICLIVMVAGFLLLAWIALTDDTTACDYPIYPDTENPDTPLPEEAFYHDHVWTLPTADGPHRIGFAADAESTIYRDKACVPDKGDGALRGN
jgi:hypothetical protein